MLDLLPFGQFKEIENNIVEIIIFEGVELNLQRTRQLCAGLAEKYRNERYAILSNRLFRYCHTHESMQTLAENQQLAGFAVLVNNPISAVAGSIHELYQDNSKVFYTRLSAVEWLRQRLVAGAKNSGILWPFREKIVGV
jgi:hypothetical protein